MLVASRRVTTALRYEAAAARDIHQHDWSRLTDRAHVQLGLDLLVELGYVAAARSGVGERGGRPTVTYEVNPRALK